MQVPRARVRAVGNDANKLRAIITKSPNLTCGERLGSGSGTTLVTLCLD